MSNTKANMKHFVETIKRLPADLYDLMKRLWVAEYEYCACFRPMWTSEDVLIRKAEKEAIYAEVEALLSDVAIAA